MLSHSKGTVQVGERIAFFHIITIPPPPPQVKNIIISSKMLGDLKL
jgi:hypothetical protein